MQSIDAYCERPPRPDGTQLVVEVADTTLSFDCSTKARLYAKTGVQDYWVVDVTGRRFLALRKPTADGFLEVAA